MSKLFLKSEITFGAIDDAPVNTWFKLGRIIITTLLGRLMMHQLIQHDVN